MSIEKSDYLELLMSVYLPLLLVPLHAIYLVATLTIASETVWLVHPDDLLAGNP